MSHKTIDINPSLFKIGLSKTKKNKDKKIQQISKPLISPNILKNKLLKRIKEHKIRETSNLENNKPKISDNYSDKITTSPQLVDLYSYTDEFNDSISYLENLSKQKKINDEKDKYNKYKEKKLMELEKKTLKNYNSINYSTPYVNIDLPEELKEPFIHSEKLNTNGDPIHLTYNKDNVPYGILKGGTKPTYRDWTKTQKNLIVTNPQNSLVLQNNIRSNTISEREQRLNALKNKITQKQMTESQENNNLENKIISGNDIYNKENSLLNTNAYDNITNNFNKESDDRESIDIIMTQNLIQPPVNNKFNDEINKSNTQQNLQKNHTYIYKNRMIKKTIRRKYTLGKSNIKRKVSILLKDRNTRKNVLGAIKDLKNKSINDIKTYLRDHNLIKIGSSAPNDVIRKMYEQSMLAGEITNNSTDILLHNLMKDHSKEL